MASIMCVTAESFLIKNCIVVFSSADSTQTERGYPLSQFVQGLEAHPLTYEAREMACHFADAYAQRLCGELCPGALAPSSFDRLVGLVVRRPPRERKIPGSNPACAGIFSGSSHTSDLKIGTPVATLPGAWRYRVSAGTGQPGVSIL